MMRMRSCSRTRRACLPATAKFAAIALAAALALGGIARATTFARMSPEELARAAEAIARGRCMGSVVEMRGGEICTVSSFEIRETWKGDAPDVVRVRLLGGRTANITSRVDGVPRFHSGEDVVLFLSHLEDGEFSMLGWAHGTFRVRRSAVTGALAVTQDTAMAEMATAIFAERPAGAARDLTVRDMPFEDFRRRIQAAILAGGDTPRRTLR